MFIGHYGVSLAAARMRPRLSLGVLFVAVQLLDVVFAILVLAGVEKLRVVHRFTAFNPYDLYRMPYSHSLAGAIVWSAIFGGGAFLWLRRRPRIERAAAAAILGGAVFSFISCSMSRCTRGTFRCSVSERARRRSGSASGITRVGDRRRAPPFSAPAERCICGERGRN